MSRLAAVAAAVCLCAASVPVQAGNLRAGAARVDITPAQDMLPLTGGQTYGSVHDPLYARALVLDSGSDKVALIAVDAAQLPNGEELIDAVTKELKIPRAHLIMSATHDHNAPTGGAPRDSRYTAPYFDILKKGIVDAARQANSRLQPARIGDCGRVPLTLSVASPRHLNLGDCHDSIARPEPAHDGLVHAADIHHVVSGAVAWRSPRVLSVGHRRGHGRGTRARCCRSSA